MNKTTPPTDFEWQMMQDLCRYIETHAEERLTLADMAHQAKLSPAYLQRRFKALIGITPRQYGEAIRVNALKKTLQKGGKVTGALYEAGFNASSRLYEKIDSHLGMTPGQYRDKGKNMVISYASYPTVLGNVMLGATDRGICFVQFGENETVLYSQLQKEYSHANLQKMPKNQEGQFTAWMKQLCAYLDGNARALALPLDIRGTAFQTKIWAYLQTIPVGRVCSYKQVAVAIGQPDAFRAVATACANNTIAIAIPCHRVLRGNGELAGYRWGLARKRALLDLEQEICNK